MQCTVYIKYKGTITQVKVRLDRIYRVAANSASNPWRRWKTFSKESDI